MRIIKVQEYVNNGEVLSVLVPWLHEVARCETVRCVERRPRTRSFDPLTRRHEDTSSELSFMWFP